MKKPVISFRHIEGSGPLSIYWHEGPYGDAVEARRGSGVGWFAGNGELLGVEFDDVAYRTDDQTLEFASGLTVSVRVSKGKAAVRVHLPRSRRRVA